MAELKTIEFQLPDMSCGHCAGRVTQALKQADPVCQVEIDLKSRTVRVHSGEDRGALSDALTEAGYAPA
ncbi:MAG: heavy-metal-associated domain-containing protein [Nitrospira sp.]|nr:heavy-metal-associated domain-containing protein [Nitrospira sp.]